MNLGQTVTMLDKALFEMGRKFLIASSAVLSVQHSALAKAKEVFKCGEKLEDAEERLRVAHNATNKAREDAKMTEEDAFEYEANYIANVGRRRDKVGDFTRQQAASAASGRKR